MASRGTDTEELLTPAEVAALFRVDPKTVTRWAKAGVWEKVFEALTRDKDNKYLMLDSTLVRVHQQAAGGKGGPRIRRWGVPEAV